MNVARSLDPAAYAAVERLGRSALAWEVLRRDPGYRDAYLALVPTPLRGSVSNPAFSVRWGCTFPEDPACSCATVRPLWTAAVDPCVLTAHISANGVKDVGDLSAFDLRRFTTDAIAGGRVTHLRVEHCGFVVRIDAIADGNTCGHVMRFAVPYDRDLASQLAALDQLLALPIADRHSIMHTRLANKLLPLLVLDQCNAGKSLRVIADEFLGPGDWPGDGEHRKSRIRRLASAGKELVRAGPKDILACR